jgi:hypothetical protein
MPWALSAAFFLLLKRNAMVPFEAGSLASYANAPQNVQSFAKLAMLVGSNCLDFWR